MEMRLCKVGVLFQRAKEKALGVGKIAQPQQDLAHQIQGFRGARAGNNQLACQRQGRVPQVEAVAQVESD